MCSLSAFSCASASAYWDIEFPESETITTITKRIIYFNSKTACYRWLLSPSPIPISVNATYNVSQFIVHCTRTKRTMRKWCTRQEREREKERGRDKGASDGSNIWPIFNLKSNIDLNMRAAKWSYSKMWCKMNFKSNLSVAISVSLRSKLVPLLQPFVFDLY